MYEQGKFQLDDLISRYLPEFKAPSAPTVASTVPHRVPRCLTTERMIFTLSVSLGLSLCLSLSLSVSLGVYADVYVRGGDPDADPADTASGPLVTAPAQRGITFHDLLTHTSVSATHHARALRLSVALCLWLAACIPSVQNSLSLSLSPSLPRRVQGITYGDSDSVVDKICRRELEQSSWDDSFRYQSPAQRDIGFSHFNTD